MALQTDSTKSLLGSRSSATQTVLVVQNSLMAALERAILRCKRELGKFYH